MSFDSIELVVRLVCIEGHQPANTGDNAAKGEK